MKSYNIYLSDNQISNLNKLAEGLRSEILTSSFNSEKAKEVQTLLAVINQIKKAGK